MQGAGFRAWGLKVGMYLLRVAVTCDGEAATAGAVRSSLGEGRPIRI